MSAADAQHFEAPANRAGWFSIDITPALGLPMGGRGPRLTPGAAVLDPLLAQALALEDAAGRRSLWMSLDLIGMTDTAVRPLRQWIADVTATPIDNVLINFAHTHSGPMTHFEGAAWLMEEPAELVEYRRRLHDELVALAVKAFNRLAPATIHWHEGTSGIGINRRLPDGEGGAIMGPNPRGTLNRDLWVLHLRTREAEAVAFTHACHPVIVYGHAWDGLSADFPGQCRAALREQLGENVHCQFFQSFAGNVRPRALAEIPQKRFRRSEPGDAPAVGRELASDVCATLESPGNSLQLSLSGATASAMLPKQDPPPIEHWQSQADSDDELTANSARYWLHRYKHGPPPIRTRTWPTGVMMLDETHGLVHLGGEAVAEWLEHVRAWLPGRRLMAWGYTQEVGGYLPTDELLDEGGYEVVSSPRNSRGGPAPFAAGLNEAIGVAVRSAEAARRAGEELQSGTAMRA